MPNLKPGNVQKFKVDQLAVEVYQKRRDLGNAAAGEAIAKIKELLSTKNTIRMIFAAAPSQNEFLAALSANREIDWSRITVFHMDDYPGLADEAPQRFSSYLKRHLFEKVHPGKVNYLIGPDSPLTKAGFPATELEKACENYSSLLKEAPIDIVCMGIGENGHIAFNDPPVADFEDPQLVKLVKLEERCRRQQVNDGCFETLAAVPTHALTLTIPALMSATWIYCMVPGATKLEAVTRTLEGPITTTCPATVLRRHQHAQLYLDLDSSAGLSISPDPTSK